MYNSEHNSPFFLSNALPLLDTPGEWYHDIRTHRLYYMPRMGETLSTVVAEAPALETLVRFVGTRETPVEGISFKGVDFAFTTWMRPSYKGHVPLQAGMYITEGYKLRPGIKRVNNHGLDNQDWLGRPSAAVELTYAHRPTSTSVALCTSGVTDSTTRRDASTEPCSTQRSATSP